MTISNFKILAATNANITIMNLSTPEIVEKVFLQYTPRLMKLSQPGTKADMQECINGMRAELMDMLYQQYYNTTSRFMVSIDLDDVPSSSPPKSSHIKTVMPNTPLK